MDLRKANGPPTSRAESTEQLSQTRPAILDECSKRRDLALLCVEEVSLDSLIGCDGEACDVTLPGRKGLDGSLPARLRMGLAEQTISREIVHGDRNDEPAGVSRLYVFTLQDVVCQKRFLVISTGTEQPTGGAKSLRDFGDDSRRSQNRQLRPERLEQVVGVALPKMIGMDRNLVDESARRPLGADEDADRVGAREGNHAAAAPDLQVANRPLERGRCHRRLVWKVR